MINNAPVAQMIASTLDIKSERGWLFLISVKKQGCKSSGSWMTLLGWATQFTGGWDAIYEQPLLRPNNERTSIFSMHGNNPGVVVDLGRRREEPGWLRLCGCAPISVNLRQLG